MEYSSAFPYDPWFDDKINPLDLMNIEEEKIDTAPCSIAPQEEEEITIHEKMYRIATSKYNPFAVGGSENIHDLDKK